MPLTVSGVIVRSADSASVVDVEKPVSENAVDPNARTDTRSAGGLAATNARAAAVAWSSAWPAIDRERSMAITTLFEAPMLVAVSPATGAPFCVKPGACDVVDGASTVTLMRGNSLVSTAFTSPAA